MPRQNYCLRACFETFKLGYKPISSWPGNHTSVVKNLCFYLNSMNVSQIYRKCFKMSFWNTSNGANISVLKVQVQSNRNSTLDIYGFIYHDPSCFLKLQANDLDGHLAFVYDQPLLVYSDAKFQYSTI